MDLTPGTRVALLVPGSPAHGVEDVAVPGPDDARWGRRVCAAVVDPVGDDALVERP